MHMRAFVGAETQQWMFQQRQQRNRSQPAERCLGGESRKTTGRRVAEEIATGIIDGDIPARERREHATREASVGCNQCSTLSWSLRSLAQHDGNSERFLL